MHLRDLPRSLRFPNFWYRASLNSDVECVLDDCDRAFDNFGSLPEGVQLVVANMMFNLGLPRFNKFKKMIRAVELGDWQSAADEMISSRWYQQVPMLSGTPKDFEEYKQLVGNVESLDYIGQELREILEKAD